MTAHRGWAGLSEHPCVAQLSLSLAYLEIN